MLDINLIRKNPSQFKEALEKRNFKPENIDRLLKMDEQRRSLIAETDSLKAEQNKKSDEYATAGDARRVVLHAESIVLKQKIAEKENLLKEVESEFNGLMHQIPNLPQEDIPVGDASANQVLRQWGEKPKFGFKPKDHLELGTALDVIDMKRAAKVSGSRFGYLKGDIVLLEFALVDLAFKAALKERFTPIIPPVLIREGVTESLGYWDVGGHEDYYYVPDSRCPKCDHAMRWDKKVFCHECGKEVIQETIIEEDGVERLKCHNDKCGYTTRLTSLYLVGTAEHSIAPMHQKETFNIKELPKRYIGFSTSFRRESGTYGKDTRGIFRVHQFDKVELFSYCLPERSRDEHSFLISFEEKLWQAIKIPYQVVQLSTGDISRPAASTVDIEGWFPGQNKYRELSSASNTTDFQARRLEIKYRKEDGKPDTVHMLNATAFGIARTLIAILENYQTKEGRVVIPEVLRDYVGKSEIEAPKKT